MHSASIILILKNSHFNLNLFPICLKIADGVDRPKIGYFEAQVYAVSISVEYFQSSFMQTQNVLQIEHEHTKEIWYEFFSQITYCCTKGWVLFFDPAVQLNPKSTFLPELRLVLHIEIRWEMSLQSAVQILTKIDLLLSPQ